MRYGYLIRSAVAPEWGPKEATVEPRGEGLWLVSVPYADRRALQQAWPGSAAVGQSVERRGIVEAIEPTVTITRALVERLRDGDRSAADEIVSAVGLGEAPKAREEE